jgi:hypothetical protein
MIKSRMMRWAWLVARIGKRDAYIYGFCGKARRKETTRKIKT